LFDNAEVYGNPRGEAERIMGEAMSQLRRENPENWKRSDILVTTKIFWGGDGVNEKGLSRKHISEGMTAALKRLQQDYVDLVFCHRPDPLTPTETVVRAMSELVRSGRATAWGTSEWSAQQFTEAVWIARTNGLEPPQFEQPQYNMFHRERFESEYHPLFLQPYNMGTTIWSPLLSGVLTGKYNSGIPEGSRMTQEGYDWLKLKLAQQKADGTLDKVAKLSRLAEQKLGCSMTQLALAWCLKNPNVSTVLLGATKVYQLEENLGALEVLPRLSSDIMNEIETTLGNKPVSYQGYGGVGMRTLDTI
jgi:voltage-dependent potassium channel beta subunit